MAKIPETMSGQCSICVPTYVMRPPSVTCSPWEKELRPVVPYTRFMPTLISASMRPKIKPE